MSQSELIARVPSSSGNGSYDILLQFEFSNMRFWFSCNCKSWTTAPKNRGKSPYQRWCKHCEDYLMANYSYLKIAKEAGEKILLQNSMRLPRQESVQAEWWMDGYWSCLEYRDGELWGVPPITSSIEDVFLKYVPERQRGGNLTTLNREIPLSKIKYEKYESGIYNRVVEARTPKLDRIATLGPEIERVPLGPDERNTVFLCFDKSELSLFLACGFRGGECDDWWGDSNRRKIARWCNHCADALRINQPEIRQSANGLATRTTSEKIFFWACGVRHDLIKTDSGLVMLPSVQILTDFYKIFDTKSPPTEAETRLSLLEL